MAKGKNRKKALTSQNVIETVGIVNVNSDIPIGKGSLASFVRFLAEREHDMTREPFEFKFQRSEVLDRLVWENGGVREETLAHVKKLCLIGFQGGEVVGW